MTATEADARSRILEVALDLMARDGSAAVSMRQLAKAADLNVATIYHHFGSKADLLRSVIADRNYPALLQVGVPVRAELPPRERLAQLLADMWDGAIAEEPVWRLVIGESLRAHGAAVEVVSDLIGQLRDALAAWLDEHFPELDQPAERVAHVVSGQVFGFFIEVMVVPRPDADRYLRDRAADLAALVFPEEG